jgi:hypothetical protein
MPAVRTERVMLSFLCGTLPTAQIGGRGCCTDRETAPSGPLVVVDPSTKLDELDDAETPGPVDTV